MKLRLALLVAALPATAIAQQLSKPEPVPFPQTTPEPRDIPYPGTMSVEVDATDTEQRIFRVKQRIPVTQAGRMTLLHPDWLPGKHAARGEVEKLAGLKISANGRRIQWVRDNVDVHAFHVDVPTGVRALDIEFQFVSATATDQGRVVITRSMMNLQPEMVTLYPAGYFTRQIPVSFKVTYPQGWRAASGLPSRVSGSTYSYQTTDYETLVDSPIFAGKHFRQEQLSPRVRLNIVADDAQYLAARPEHIAAHRRLVEQSIKLFGAQHYDNYEFLLALTDEMGSIGLEHHRSSENGVNREYFTEWDKGPGRRNLLPHEFVHSWNGKHRRPAQNWTPNFNTPMRDDLLWVYEGQTQFWGYVLGARSGLFSKPDTLDALASIAANLDIREGRDWRPLQDTTNDPVITPRRPKAWTSWQRSEDYYNEGMMIWIEADALIRQRTNGARGMDEVARAFFGQRDNDWGIDSYEFEDIVAALDGVTAYDWAGFLRERLDRVGTATPTKALADAGYRLTYSEEPSLFITDGERRAKTVDLSWSLGLSSKAGELTQVIWEGPAFKAGLAVGQKIVAVNGLTYSDERLKDAVKAKAPVRLTLQQGEEWREVTVDYRGGLRYPKLVKVGRDEGSLDRLLAPRP